MYEIEGKQVAAQEIILLDNKGSRPVQEGFQFFMCCHPRDTLVWISMLGLQIEDVGKIVCGRGVNFNRRGGDFGTIRHETTRKDRHLSTGSPAKIKTDVSC